ncbi:hypothetical protein ACPPVQ_19015 [Diaminobutyricibacter sp. McL0618]|uniref:hypothetical protein n=1 Tax=Leifsonia sp. McL0618 TaxID=3415677 RepID=UPI003CF65195
MSSTETESTAAAPASRSKVLGIITLILSITTAALALAIVGIAAALYWPIGKATTISACEGPSLTAAQEQVSLLVENLKSLAIFAPLALGGVTLAFGLIAALLNMGHRLLLVAVAILVLAAVATVLVLLFAFPIDPNFWHLSSCGNG